MKKFLPIILFLAMLVIGYLLFLPKKTTADMHRAKADLSVSAIELYADFRQDEAAANEKYLNKTVVVQGEVVGVAVSGKGLPKIKLASKDQQFGVVCSLDPESSHRRREFHEGEMVTLKCICMDYYTDVEMTNCVVND